MKKVFISIIVVIILSAILVSAGDRFILKITGNASLEDVIKDVKDKPYLLYFKLAKAYFNKGSLDKSEELFERSTEFRENFPEAFHNQGVVEYEKGNIDAAIKKFTKALELDDKYTKAYYSRGLAYFAKRDFDSAISDLEKVVELDPDDANAHFDIGVSYSEKFKDMVFAELAVQEDLNLIKKAKEHYLMADEIEPGFPNALSNAEIMQKTIDDVESQE